MKEFTVPARKNILQDILAELRQIRHLLEWSKADTLATRAENLAREDANKSEYLATQQEFADRLAERYRKIVQDEREIHEQMYHGKKVVN